jgi:hypothetical protein
VIGRAILLAGAALCLASCGGGLPPDPPISAAPTPTPPPPPPPPTGGARSYDVTACLLQDTGGGITLAQLVNPDVLTIDFSRPSKFPNGRALPDSVVDRTLAALFLDLRVHSIDTFVNLPLNPPANDRPFRAAFPYLAPPQGNPPVETPGGTNFNFRTDAPAAYTRVDRTGFPALATALVSAAQREAFNDGSAADDLQPSPEGTFKWVPEFRAGLTALTNALGDDLEALNLTLCARRL